MSLLRATFAAAPSPQEITLKWLLDRGVRLRELVSVANIPVTDLYRAGIARTLNDLVALGFRPHDLTVNRACFNVNQLVSVFRADYHVLHDCDACGGFNFVTIMHTIPRFTSDELQTLGVTAADLLLEPDGTFSPETDCRILIMAGFSMEEWRDVGLTAEILERMHVTAQVARTKLVWDPTRVASVFGMPEGWLSKR